MFKYKSKVSFACAILGTIYALYLIIYFFSGIVGASSSMEALGSGLAALLLAPYMIVIVLAVIFNWVGFSLAKSGFVLTAAILYSVSSVLFILYIPFVIPMIVLGFIGYVNQKKLNDKKARDLRRRKRNERQNKRLEDNNYQRYKSNEDRNNSQRRPAPQRRTSPQGRPNPQRKGIPKNNRNQNDYEY